MEIIIIVSCVLIVIGAISLMTGKDAGPVEAPKEIKQPRGANGRFVKKGKK